MGGRKKLLGDEKGQMLVEFGFMLFMLLAPLLATLLVTYEFLEKLVSAQQHLRYELRDQIDKDQASAFKRIEKSVTARADVPKALRWFMGTDKVEAKVSLSSYGGCYQNVGLSEFRQYHLARDVTGLR